MRSCAFDVLTSRREQRKNCTVLSLLSPIIIAAKRQAVGCNLNCDSWASVRWGRERNHHHSSVRGEYDGDETRASNRVKDGKEQARWHHNTAWRSHPMFHTNILFLQHHPRTHSQTRTYKRKLRAHRAILSLGLFLLPQYAPIACLRSVGVE